MKPLYIITLSLLILATISSCARRPVATVPHYGYYPDGLFYGGYFYDPMFYHFVPRGNRVIIIDRRTENQVAAPRRNHVRQADPSGVGRRTDPNIRQQQQAPQRTPRREGTVAPGERQRQSPRTGDGTAAPQDTRRRGTTAPPPRREAPSTAPQQRQQTPTRTAPPSRRESEARPAPQQRQQAPAPPAGTGGTRSRRGG